MKQLAELGVQGSGQYRNQEYQGVLQHELAKAITKSDDCRLTVFRELKDKFITSPAAPPPLSDKPSNSNREPHAYNREATLRYWQNSFINKYDSKIVFGSLNEMVTAFERGEINPSNPRVIMEFSKRIENTHNRINEIVEDQARLSANRAIALCLFSFLNQSIVNLP